MYLCIDMCCIWLLYDHMTVLVRSEYTELGGDEELPLGEEFQDHIKIFISPHRKKPRDKYKLLGKLVQQLE